MVPETCSVTNGTFLSFWTVFSPFTLLWTKKIKILKQWKKHLKILSFYKYHKWQSYNVWTLRYRVQQTVFLSFWTVFCLFTPLTTQKIKTLKKWKKHLEDIIILHICTINDNQNKKKHLEILSFYTCVP